MHILIAALSAARGPSGICRHAYNLVRCASRHPKITRVYLLIGKWQENYFRSSFAFDDPKVTIISVDISNFAIARNVWYLRSLPGIAGKLQVDIVHLSFPVPILRRLFDCAVIVSLHDFYPYDEPRNFGFPKVIFNRLFLRKCLKETDAVACVSEATMSRLKIWAPRVAHRKGVVVHNCVDIRSIDSTPMSSSGRKAQFFLMVAQHRANKNIVLALRVFSELIKKSEVSRKTFLLVVGNEGPETAKIKRFIKRGRLQDDVRLIDGMSDRSLTDCYVMCELLIAPSRIEGFGLPVGEALACGSRVVCSDIPAFREIGGETCHYFDLNAASPELAMTVAIHKALTGPKPKAGDFRQMAIKNVSDSYVVLYERISWSCCSGGNICPLS
jgi:glycosyltransferase involved in cell wall biosynthesis